MKKLVINTFIIIGGLLLSTFIWHVFIKDYDYKISFTEQTAPGTIYQGIQDWNNLLIKRGDLEVIQSTHNKFSSINQTVKLGDSIITFDWTVQSLNDSITETTVKILDKKHSISNRLASIFSNPPIREILISKVSQFKKGLDSHLKNHKVQIIGESQMPENFYAYISIKSNLAEKAQNMIASNGGILEILRQNNFEILGKPTLEITSWDIEKEELIFNFMFPIKEKDTLPDLGRIKFKKLASQKAIKANYFGNYRTSDRAWFALIEYASRNKLNIEKLPIEFFYNNPMLGGNELEWKAEIFLPLKE